MKGYFSFILVFLLSLLIISSIELYQTKSSFSLSKAIVSERTYDIGSNAQHSISQSLRGGAKKGFEEYDSTHLLAMCNHCPDYYCNPTPTSTNVCDSLLCSRCFRDTEAKESAKLSAVNSISLLRQTGFDSDFLVSFNQPEIEIFLTKEIVSRNGVKFSYLRTVSPINLTISSSKFAISASKMIDSGWVLYG